MNALKAFKSQFHNPDSSEPETFISNPGFLKLIESRGHELGYSIGVKYGEGFTIDHHLGVENLFHLIWEMLWSQPVYLPLPVYFGKHDAVVQTAWAPLPEFNF